MRILEVFSLWAGAALMLSIATWLWITGYPRLSLEFFVSPAGASGLTGGIGPIILNTFVITGSALLLAIPVALAGSVASIAASQRGPGHLARTAAICNRIVDIGLCLPRLLWGLAGAAIFGHLLGLGISAATGILTLALLLVPILTAGFREALGRSVDRYGLACRALGYSDYQIIREVALRSATPNLLASVLIASGRAMGDAAALILTAGIGTRLISGPFDSGSTLAVHIYLIAVEIGGGLPTAAAAAFVLLITSAVLQAPLVLLAGRGLAVGTKYPAKVR